MEKIIKTKKSVVRIAYCVLRGTISFCFVFLFVTLLFVAACGSKQRSPSALVPGPLEPTSRMNKKDRFQATRWLEAAQYLELSSDYVGAWEQCQKILSYYPDTLYAKEAEIIIKKIQIPSNNRARDFYRDNPGIFGGY